MHWYGSCAIMHYFTGSEIITKLKFYTVHVLRRWPEWRIIHVTKLQIHKRWSSKTNASVLHKDMLKSGEESLDEPLDGGFSCTYITENILIHKYSRHLQILLFCLKLLLWLNFHSSLDKQPYLFPRGAKLNLIIIL